MSRTSILTTMVMALGSVIYTAGCATVEVVTVSQLHGQQLAADSMPIAHIYADNWGIYLFKFIPP